MRNRLWLRVAAVAWLLVGPFPAGAQDQTLERLLRAQAFNQEFEGYDHYQVTIEADRSQQDGSREVTAVASGRFLEHVKRLKVLFLIVGDQVVGGQILEQQGLPPCAVSSQEAL
ncbi:MAG: hypothetical protein AB1411_07570 [Nitrospirota bacterium]